MNEEMLGTDWSFRPNSITTGYINNTRNNLNEGNLIFVDMKIENNGDENRVVITYIDNENFKEIKRSFNCDIVFEKTALFSFADDINKFTFNYKITNTNEIIETSKDI